MRHISSCLTQQLQTVHPQVLQLTELQHKINYYLPKELQKYYFVKSFVRGCLLIITHHANLAAQFNCLIPDLRNKLRNEVGLYQLVSIKLQVTTTQVTTVMRPTNPIKLSKHTQALILAASESCQYAPLSAALRHLGTSSQSISA